MTTKKPTKDTTVKPKNTIKGFSITQLVGEDAQVNVIYERGIIKIDTHVADSTHKNLEEAVAYINSVVIDPTKLP